MPLPVHDLVVVGGGIAGLAAAWRAQQAGRDVLLLEEGPRVGGVIRTERLGAYRVERAAATIPSTATHLLDLAAALPGGPRLLPARPEADRQFLLMPGGLRRVPRSPGTFLSSGLLSPGAKLRIFSEVLRGPRRGSRSETLEGFVARRFGPAVAQRFLVPFTSGIYGAHPGRLGAGDAFPLLPALERRRGSVIRGLIARLQERAAARTSDQPRAKRAVLLVEGGTEELTKALGRALGERAWLEAGVRALVPPAPDDPGGLHTLTLAAGDRVQAREVLLAAPAWRQAALIAPFAPHLAEVLAGVRYTPIAVAAVGLPPGSPRVPEGFGFLRGHRTRARILGATFHGRLSDAVAPAGHDLVLVFLGGSEDPGLLDLPDDAVRDVALLDLGRALGGPLRPDLLDVHRWPRAIPLFAPGHRGRMAEVQAALSRWSLRLSGSHITGVGLDACVAP